MKITSAETEGTHSGAAWMSDRLHPRTAHRVDVERRVSGHQCGRWLADLDRRRQDFVLQSENRFENSGRTGRGFRVTDLRLHRADRAPVCFGRTTRAAASGLIDLHQTGDLGRVTHLRPGPVRFNQFDRVGRDSRHAIRVFETPNLPLRLRRVDGVPRAVARRADPFDHGVDSVAISLGIGEPLQDDHAHAFAQDRAARIVAERLRIARRRQRGSLAEAHEHEDVVERVDAASHDHVAPPGPQLQRGEVHRAEAARAGRVHDAVGPMQIEPVRDPAGHHISQQPRKRILLPRDVTL